MKSPPPIKTQSQPRGGITTAFLLLGCIAAGCVSHSGQANPDIHSKNSSVQITAAAHARQPLTGAELYAVNCNRCHPERYPTERTPTEWTTILTHMRVRANLPATQAREILKYLQENSGS